MTTLTKTWTLNGVERKVTAPALRRLLDILREDLNLTGTKEGCGEGECGACTIVLDGSPHCSCLLTMAQVRDGATLLTIEGLEETAAGAILQQAYLETGAVQCGFCIPGMLMSSYALLSRTQTPSDEEIRVAHAGNICRCTGYVKIIEAVKLAASRWPKA